MINQLKVTTNTNLIPIWNNDLSTVENSSAYTIHYLIDRRSSLEAHFTEIVSLIEGAKKKSVVYPATYVYSTNDVPALTVEKLTKEIRTRLNNRPVAIPIKLITLSYQTNELGISKEITKNLLRQIKRLCHPPVILKKWLIMIDGFTDPLFAIISDPIENRNQLIRIHIVQAPQNINNSTELDFLNKQLNYSYWEVSGVAN